MPAARRSRSLRAPARVPARASDVAATAVVADAESGEDAEAPKQQESNKPRAGGKGPPKRGLEQTLSFEELVEGQSYPGKVVAVKEYGAFVSIGAPSDGLVHISEVADAYVEDINEVVNVGQDVTCRLISVDMDKKKLQLSMREPREQRARGGGEGDGSYGRGGGRGGGMGRGGRGRGRGRGGGFDGAYGERMWERQEGGARPATGGTWQSGVEGNARPGVSHFNPSYGARPGSGGGGGGLDTRDWETRLARGGTYSPRREQRSDWDSWEEAGRGGRGRGRGGRGRGRGRGGRGGGRGRGFEDGGRGRGGPPQNDW